MASSTLPSTMYAWQGSPRGKVLTKVNVPVPQFEPDGILVKVFASGVCHSDCFILSSPPEMFRHWKSPFTMGHEGSGQIMKLGSGLTGSKFHERQSVVVLCTPGCNKESCGECSRGLHNLCKIGESPGLGTDGVFAQYIAVKPWGIVPLPDGIPHEVAAVTSDAVLTAFHAVKVAANLLPGQTVIIYGLGGVGFNALQMAQHLRAARIIVVDRRMQPLDKAVELGVAKDDAIFSEGDIKLTEKVAKEDIIADCAIDFVGTQETFTAAQLSVRSGGTVVLAGLFADQVPIISLLAVTRGIRFQCSYNGTREELVECLELVAKGVIKPSIQTGSIDDLPQVLEDLDNGRVKSRMVLIPTT
ncbi:chaperonin 10-like protein [Calycina marina]|uniref:Chaperonin 10-like protein n=1 Tax=Calycina marina TaxID=1763456 RepID=A0A9P7ZBY3_9HELO|nr:chaperonin 10-like protein [Calycina marina]